MKMNITQTHTIMPQFERGNYKSLIALQTFMMTKRLIFDARKMMVDSSIVSTDLHGSAVKGVLPIKFKPNSERMPIISNIDNPLAG